jgi:hypothetical protein
MFFPSRIPFALALAAMASPSVAWAQLQPGTGEAPPEPEPEPAQPTTPAQSEETSEDVFASLTKELEQPATETDEAPLKSETTGPPPGSNNLLNPDISLIADFAAAGFSVNDHLQTGGHDPQRNGFNLQSLELSFQSYVDPYFRFDAHIVYGPEGLELEEAYGTTIDLPAGFGARLGQFLTRFGRHNPTHPHQWDFVDQPFALGRVFGGDGNRNLGVELSWLTPLPWFVELSASATMAEGEGTARSFYGDDDQGVEDPGDLLYVTRLQQFFPLSDDWSLDWGVSGAFGPNSAGPSSRTAVYGTDLYLHYRPISTGGFALFTWQTELLHRRRQLPELAYDTSGYTQLVFRFARRWGTGARYEYGSPTYDSSGERTTDELDPDWTGTRQRVSANVTHFPSEFSRFRLQGSSDIPTWRSRPIWAVFLAAELAIGAHGAHKF